MKNEKRNIKKSYSSYVEEKPVKPEVKPEVKPAFKPEVKPDNQTIVFRPEKKPEEKKSLVSNDLKLRY